MAHAFDTGLAKPQRTLVLEGALFALSGLSVASGGYLAAIEDFGGVVRTWTDVDGVGMLAETLQGRAPAVAVAVGDRSVSPAGVGGYGTKSDLDVLVYFVSNHARDPLLGRMTADAVALANDAADPGINVMLEHVEELLIGSRFGASSIIKQARLTREEELLTRPDMSIWVQTYAITLARSIDANRTVTQILASFGLRTILSGLDTTPVTGVAEVNLPAAKTLPTTVDAVTTIPAP